DGKVAALDVAGLAQTLVKCANKLREWFEIARPTVEKSDHRHRRLLRTRRQRPRRRRAADAREECAPRRHSITPSARASSSAGTSMPSALAVFRLITRSNLTGCSTGRSAGFAPRRILST